MNFTFTVLLLLGGMVKFFVTVVRATAPEPAWSVVAERVIGTPLCSGTLPALVTVTTDVATPPGVRPPVGAATWPCRSTKAGAMLIAAVDAGKLLDRKSTRLNSSH